MFPPLHYRLDNFTLYPLNFLEKILSTLCQVAQNGKLFKVKMDSLLTASLLIREHITSAI